MNYGRWAPKFDIYLDYITWNRKESEVKYFPFICGSGYNIQVKVKKY